MPNEPEPYELIKQRSCVSGDPCKIAGMKSLWEILLTTAILTPSPHNIQPWRIRILSEREADLYIDGRRTLPKEDLTGSFLLSAMGMFVEALSILSAPCGYTLEYAFSNSPKDLAKKIAAEKGLISFARLRLTTCSPKQPLYPESFFSKRRTSRISLLPDAVRDEATRALRDLAQKWDQSYHQLTDPKLIEEILKQNTKALFEDLNTADYHDEITSWFRFTDRAAKTHRDGLDWRCMNTSRIAFWLAARAPWLLLSPLTSALFRAQYRRQLGLVPTVGFLAGEFFDPSFAFEAGRFLISFWLEATSHGLYLHPYGNLVTNPAAAAWLGTTTGFENIWLIFKIGYSEEPPKSYRRSIDEILVKIHG